MIDGFPAPVVALLQYWMQARDGDGLPTRNALDPLRFKRWIGDLSIVERRAGRKSFFVSLHGSRTAAHVGDCFHQAYLEDRVPRHALHHCLEPYRVAISAQRPVLAIIRPGTLTGKFRKFERLILPFADRTGADVGRFLVWVDRTGRDRVRSDTIFGDKPAGLNPFLRRESEDSMLILDVSPSGAIEIAERIEIAPFRGHPSYSLFGGFRPRSLPV